MSGGGGSGDNLPSAATDLAAPELARDESSRRKLTPLPNIKGARHGNFSSSAKGLEIAGAAAGRGEGVLPSMEEEEEVGEISQYASVSSADASIPVAGTLRATPLLVETDVHTPASRHELVDDRPSSAASAVSDQWDEGRGGSPIMASVSSLNQAAPGRNTHVDARFMFSLGVNPPTEVMAFVQSTSTRPASRW